MDAFEVEVDLFVTHKHNVAYRSQSISTDRDWTMIFHKVKRE